MSSLDTITLASAARLGVSSSAPRVGLRRSASWVDAFTTSARLGMSSHASDTIASAARLGVSSSTPRLGLRSSAKAAAGLATHPSGEAPWQGGHGVSMTLKAD